MFTIHRFTYDDSSATILETFRSFENMGVRWSLPGGLQRIEITIKVNSKYELHDRLDNHSGQRIAIYSPQMSRPISGWISEVSSDGEGLVQYVLQGSWRRFKDVYDVTVYDPTDTSGEVLATMLTDHCLFYSGDATNIDTGGSTIGGWVVDDEIGTILENIIIDMMDMSDSSYNKYDFWMVDDRIRGNQLQQLTPYFKPRGTGNDITWQVDIDELGRLNTSLGISQTASNIEIFYDTVGGTAFSGSATTLSDPLFASFITEGVTEGDRVVNNTDGSVARVVTVDGEEDLTISTLSGGTANVFANGDSYTITLQNLQSVTASGTAPNNIWTKYIKEIKRGFNLAQATRYANMLLSQKNAYKQQTPFTINSRTIRDRAGARWPLLEMIARGGGYIRINDLYPNAAMYNQSTNNITNFFITSMDYDNVSGQMRVTVDNPDTRLDARLVTAGILNNTMIGRK